MVKKNERTANKNKKQKLQTFIFLGVLNSARIARPAGDSGSGADSNFSTWSEGVTLDLLGVARKGGTSLCAIGLFVSILSRKKFKLIFVLDG